VSAHKLHNKEKVMLQELNKQEMRNVIGGKLAGQVLFPNIPGTKPYVGTIFTIYVDKDGNIVCGIPPKGPKPWSATGLVRK
jgi:hypothetical protein